MEELIGLLLVLLFGGIEAWSRAKKKKARKEARKKALAGDAGLERESAREEKTSLPEAWPALVLEEARAQESAPVQERAVPADLAAVPEPAPKGSEQKAESLPQSPSPVEAVVADTAEENRLPGTDISMRDAVVASVILERKYV